MIRGASNGGSGGWPNGWPARTPTLWAGGGFIAGIVFWHLVGFWSLINMAVTGAGEISRPGMASSPQTRTKPSPLETGSVRKVSSAGCVALIRHPRSGETRSGPCLAGTFHQLNAGIGTKDDLAVGAASWTTRMR
ncbi:MAG TPA: hypothetical protein VFX71_00430 [Hyphomicrobium sp.]|nr:hypothetical protein [Hyphomicrobium sp.]